MSALAVALAQDPARRARVAQAARATACERFDIDRAVDRYIELYAALLG